MFKHKTKIQRERMPQPAKTRAIRYRYPWDELEPGEGFEFAPLIKIMSARVMCTNNGRELTRVFRCYRGVDEKLYAIRTDGMHSELPEGEMINAPRITAATAPKAAEVYGDFGKIGNRNMPDNEKNVLASSNPGFTDNRMPTPPGPDD